jgi:hypothetical protein
MNKKLIIFLCINYLSIFLIDFSYVWERLTNDVTACGNFFVNICFNVQTSYHLGLLILLISIPLSYYLLLKEKK